MKNVIFPDEGLARSLATLLELPGHSSFINGYAMLWVNNPYTPSRDSVLADLTEASFAGYARVNVSGSTYGWAAPAVATHVASSEAPEVTFTCTGSGTAQHIYGWAIVDYTNSKLLAISTFDSVPKTIDTTGQEVKFTPTLTLASAFTAP